MSLDVISALFKFLKFASTLSARFSISSYGIALFSQAFNKPSKTFALSKTSLVPSFLMTTNGDSSILSKVVNLVPQLSHSRRRRMAFISSACLESTTFELVCLQFGQRIRLQIGRASCRERR